MIKNNFETYKFFSQDVSLEIPVEGIEASYSRDFWKERGCGIACIQMVLHGFGKAVPHFSELVKDGLNNKAYILGKGWGHAGLAALLGERGVDARSEFLRTERELTTILLSGGALIMSVSPGLRGGLRGSDGKIVDRGGHLVVCHGVSGSTDGTIQHLLISDPDYYVQFQKQSVLCELHQVLRSWTGGAIICRNRSILNHI